MIKRKKKKNNLLENQSNIKDFNSATDTLRDDEKPDISKLPCQSKMTKKKKKVRGGIIDPGGIWLNLVDHSPQPPRTAVGHNT